MRGEDKKLPSHRKVVKYILHNKADWVVLFSVFGYKRLNRLKKLSELKLQHLEANFASLPFTPPEAAKCCLGHG